MSELITERRLSLEGLGLSRVRVHGGPLPHGGWYAWLEIRPPRGHGPPVRGGRETLQRDRAGVEAWARALDRRAVLEAYRRAHGHLLAAPRLTLRHVAEPVESDDGTAFEALVCGAQAPDGVWHGWIEFHPEAAGQPSLATGYETSQAALEPLERWAGLLGPSYVEAAFRRAHGLLLGPNGKVVIHDLGEVRDRQGQPYHARVLGERVPDAYWVGWLVFSPLGGGGGTELWSDRETSQPDRRALEYWAQGLEPVYLEGALERALGRHRRGEAPAGAGPDRPRRRRRRGGTRRPRTEV